MKKNPLVINFAVIIIRKIELYEHIIRYLHKFNVTNILIIKRKGLKTNTKILKKYKISYDIVKSYENKNIYENLIIYKKKLPIFFFHLNSENFLNQNLFDLKEVIRRNPNKLIYFKNNSLIPSIKVFNKNRLNFYQKVEKKNFLNKNCKIISFKKKDLLILHKDQNKKKIQKFFKKIYSKNLILDRDGVINKNLGYVSEISDLKWVNGFIKAIQYLNKKNYNLFVATNQSGVARGFYSEKKVILLHQYIKKILQRRNCYLNQFYYCPYHPKGRIMKYKKNSNLRKPKNGMFLAIKNDWNIDTKNTSMIGDQQSDIDFAKNCKIKSYLFKEKNLFLFVKKNF